MSTSTSGSALRTYGDRRAIARFLAVSPEPLAAALQAARSTSVGRWRKDLSADQVADVEEEAGALLAELGYLRSS